MNRFSGYFIICFLTLAVVMAGFVMNGAIKGVESPTFTGIWKGSWAPTFEKSLNEELPVATPSKNTWGLVEFTLFGQGRKGVLVGKDGWLFTDEEFSCLPHAQKQMEENLAYIEGAQKTFKEKKIELVVAIIPAKSRVYPDYLGSNIMPECRKKIYDDTVLHLGNKNIRVIGLLPYMLQAQDKDSLFLKTDTHWTPEGARVAAAIIAESLKDYEFPSKAFKTGIGEDKPHEGDLLRYLPGVDGSKVKRDALKVYITEVDPESASQDAAASLFGDDIPPMTLVGTSYSANPLWNFPGFLKEFSKADILNMADEGLGPFAVMEKYLASKALEETPPVVVIWEVPERYMTMKPDFAAPKQGT